MVVRRPPQLTRPDVVGEHASSLQEPSPASVPEGCRAAAVQERRVGPLLEQVLRDPALAAACGVVQRRLLGDRVQHRPRRLGQLDVGVDLGGVGGGVDGAGRASGGRGGRGSKDRWYLAMRGVVTVTSLVMASAVGRWFGIGGSVTVVVPRSTLALFGEPPPASPPNVTVEPGASAALSASVPATDCASTGVASSSSEPWL